MERNSISVKKDKEDKTIDMCKYEAGKSTGYNEEGTVLKTARNNMGNCRTELLLVNVICKDNLT